MADEISSTVAWNIAGGISALSTLGIFAYKGLDLSIDTYNAFANEDEDDLGATAMASLVAVGLIIGAYLAGKYTIRPTLWGCNLFLSAIGKSPYPTGIPHCERSQLPDLSYSDISAWAVASLLSSALTVGLFTWRGYKRTISFHDTTLEYVGLDYKEIANLLASIYAVGFILLLYLGGKYALRGLLWLGNLALTAVSLSCCPTEIPRMQRAVTVEEMEEVLPINDQSENNSTSHSLAS